MRALKLFSISLFICSLILFSLNGLFERDQSESIWIKADSDILSVSVNDDRDTWLQGISAGVGADQSLTDRVRLTHIGNMDADHSLRATFTVTDDIGRTASLVRKVRLIDYTEPTYALLQFPVLQRNAVLDLSKMIMVYDSLDGDITHLVRVVRSNLDTSTAGNYEVCLTVSNSCGVSADYTLAVTVL